MIPDAPPVVAPRTVGRIHPLDTPAPLARLTRRIAQHGDDPTMAKPTTQQIKLVSTADTGYFYVKKKNTRATTQKLQFKKYDPKARKHVLFKEQKMR